jgi:hypothetical protein
MNLPKGATLDLRPNARYDVRVDTPENAGKRRDDRTDY